MIETRTHFHTDTELDEATVSVLHANPPVDLGKRFEHAPTESLYPLIQHYEGKAVLEDDGWSIELCGENGEAIEQARESNRVWQLPTEGLDLKLRHPGASLQEHETKAAQITALLFLADGTGVNWHRYMAMWEEHGSLEILGRWTGDETGPGMMSSVKSALSP